MRRSLIILIMGCLALPGAFSCRTEESSATKEAARGEVFEISRSYGSGPVKFALEVSAKSITTADSLVCRMTLDVAEGYEAEFPDIAFPDDVPGSILTRFEERETKEGDRRRQVREYEIEPEFEGALRFPAMEAYYHKAGEVKEERLEIEPVEVTVAAAELGGDAMAFRPARGLIETDRIEAMRRRIWPKALGAVAIGVILVVAIVWWARRPKVEPPAPPAHEIALKRLRELERSDLIGRHKVEPFFVAVTEIVRDYVEAAFGLRAPEQTTEEFLASLATATELVRHREVLQPFLTAADEVKFARLDADETAMKRAFETAERFVRQTSRTEGGGQ